ncbi:MAG: porin family protein [Gammaproteobacteria bacterium]|jgi:opacity protein-like surface antigen|nr:porin family protein [Gammaproteobacteria bacterium]MDH3863964.1 porin family protein [Gammaproteobacteria bacterium]MDH3905855.1 porin family protein [Gammaproteobacteria bacterium]NCF60467.1 outer membrane beta-barrel protein [Gammaproteobacteria bacterium]
MTIQTRIALLAGAALFTLNSINADAAESGFFMGGSVGTAAVEANVNDGIILPDPAPVFDEDDFGWKFLAGYDFALSDAFSLGIEGGYVDLGSPAADVLTVPISLDPTGLNLYGTAGVDIGPVGLFAKYGFIDWEVEGSIGGIDFDDDGNDPAYGVGVRFNLGSIEIRGEYEIFDISDAEDVTLLSAGIVVRF